MEEWDMSRRKSSRREEESKCVGGKGGREVNGGKYREQERGMMGVIRIKTVGFGQSRVRAGVSMPTPHPPPVPSSSPNQPLWHMGGASMTHKQTTHGCAGNILKTLNRQKNTLIPDFIQCFWSTIVVPVMSVVDDWIFTGGLLIWLDMMKWDYSQVSSSVPTHEFKSTALLCQHLSFSTTGNNCTLNVQVQSYFTRHNISALFSCSLSFDLIFTLIAVGTIQSMVGTNSFLAFSIIILSRWVTQLSLNCTAMPFFMNT